MVEGLHAVVDGIPPETIRERLKSLGNGGTDTIVEEGILAIQEGVILYQGWLPPMDTGRGGTGPLLKRSPQSDSVNSGAIREMAIPPIGK